MELVLFDVVDEAVRSLAPDDLGPIRTKVRAYGIKVWFGEPVINGEHYEAQVVGPNLVDDAEVLALEIGFHSEHPGEQNNDIVVDRIAAAEKRWRKKLGPEAEIDAFLGRATHWRRISETWADPDLSDPTIGIEIASRLVDYATALEPARRAP